jgi:hypothetical protein
MKKMMVFLMLAVAHVQAAPMPLTSSSLFISAERGLFHSASGFTINAASTDWQQMSPPKNNSYIETVYRAPNRGPNDSKGPAALTVRAESLPQSTSLENFANKWLKDYPRLGFDILTAKKVKVGEQVAFMLDLVSRENSKQLRQVIFVKGKSAVTLTCRDDISTFAQSLKSCNEIARTFRW